MAVCHREQHQRRGRRSGLAGDDDSVDKLRARPVVVLIALGTSLAGCGHAKPQTDHAVRTKVGAGKAVGLTNDQLGVAVTADPDVLPPGTLTVSRPASPPPVARGTTAPVDVSVDRAEDLRGVIHIRFKVPPATPTTASVAYWDDTGHQWLPMPSRRDGDDLVVDSPHLTWLDWWADWLDSPDNPLTAVAGQLMGDRAAVPNCGSAKPPGWVIGSATENNSASQQLYTCLSSADDDLIVTAVNNRGIPVALSLNTPAAPAAVDAGWPTSIGDLLTKIIAAVPGRPSEILLPATGTATLRFHPPTVSGQILGYVHPDALSILAYILTQAVGQYDASRSIGGWNISRAGVDCMLALSSTAHDTLVTDKPTASQVAADVQTFAGCMSGAIDQEIAILQHSPDPTRPPLALKQLNKVGSRFFLYTLGQAAATLADSVLDARTDILTSPDISIAVEPAALAAHPLSLPANTVTTATGGGIDTGVSVRQGARVRVTATGIVTYGTETGPPGDCSGATYTQTAQVEPDGSRIIGSTPCASKIDPSCPLPTAPVGAVIARIGDGAWTLIGTKAEIVAPRDGELWIGFNDWIPSDNQGSYTVTVQLLS
jgi:hypothetical protein